MLASRYAVFGNLGLLCRVLPWIRLRYVDQTDLEIGVRVPRRLFSVEGIPATLALACALTLSSHPAAAQPTGVHSARIHTGACARLGPVAFELNGFGARDGEDGTPTPAVEPVGSDDAVPLAASETQLESSLSKLAADDHALAIYATAAGAEQVIACGGVGGSLSVQMAGMVMPGDELAVGLAETDDSGYSGIALIRAEGTMATVRIFLIGDSEPE